MTNSKLLIAYEGTNYFGWQKTKEGPSIEEELEKALFRLFQKEIRLLAASRTDRGVHAEGQVVSFLLPKPFPLERIPSALHALLPKDIRILCISREMPSFHPTLDALWKEYHYTIVTREILYPLEHPFSWHYPRTVCLDTMRAAAQNLLGTHDFRGFSNRRKEETKNSITALLSLDIEKSAEKIVFRMKGKSFLYKMVRNIVGTLLYIGEGKLPPETVCWQLQHKKRSLGGVSAPATGLVLKQVAY